MKKFAVGYIDFFNNDLIIEIVVASDWKAALRSHSKVKGAEFMGCKTLEEAKIIAFDCDEMIDVKEV